MNGMLQESAKVQIAPCIVGSLMDRFKKDGLVVIESG